MVGQSRFRFLAVVSPFALSLSFLNVSRVVYGYADLSSPQMTPVIKVIGKGTGLFAEVRPLLSPEAVHYVYARMSVQLENSPAPVEKMLLITWVGERVSVMKRARVSIQKSVFVRSIPVGRLCCCLRCAHAVRASAAEHQR
jgi:hypothetical protein